VIQFRCAAHSVERRGAPPLLPQIASSISDFVVPGLKQAWRSATKPEWSHMLYMFANRAIY